ncbi:MAG TPA: amidase family protein [Hyphomonadaceae bacterium]|nr:amidase family protein [Hyphomonadaceae bacterium]HPN06225.1 amidase family protein [Hyphomonadaceae bacterium]
MAQAPHIFETARTQLDQLALGQVSAAELLEEHIERSGVVNPAINAVVRTNLEEARSRALELDRLLMSGIPAGPLHGLPITIKDTFDVEGMPATSGAPEYANRPARTADAAAVARLRAAGAVIWGKTNTPYLAGDSQTYNAVHGRTSNPWDLSRTPGGSSGGAAAALATGITSLELGSDIGGSLRLPAHFCGVAALKPTFGRTPIMGHVPPAPGSLAVRDLNVAGPMARDVADLRLMFQVLTDQPVTVQPRKTGLKARRIGVWADDKAFAISAECKDGVEIAAQAAAEAGAQVLVAKPEIDGNALIDLYLQLLLPILASDMPAPLVKALEAGRPIAKLMARGEPFSIGKWALYSAATHHDWLKADETRRRLKRTMSEFFSRWHAIITPVAPTTAFEHVESGDAVTRLMKVDGKPVPYHMFHAWIALATVCHLPSVVIPVPRRAGELPCGVQIIGPEGGDLDVLAIAEALEAQMGGFQRPKEAVLLAPMPARVKGKPVKQKPAPKPKLVKEKPAKVVKPKPAPKVKPPKPVKPAKGRR